MIVRLPSTGQRHSSMLAGGAATTLVVASAPGAGATAGAGEAPASTGRTSTRALSRSILVAEGGSDTLRAWPSLSGRNPEGAASVHERLVARGGEGWRRTLYACTRPPVV